MAPQHLTDLEMQLLLALVLEERFVRIDELVANDDFAALGQHTIRAVLRRLCTGGFVTAQESFRPHKYAASPRGTRYVDLLVVEQDRDADIERGIEQLSAAIAAWAFDRRPETLAELSRAVRHANALLDGPDVSPLRPPVVLEIRQGGRA